MFIRSMLFLFFFCQELGANPGLIDYQSVRPIFENRCSACHNSHFNARKGLSNWSVEIEANNKRQLIKYFVIDQHLMPKKWSEKYNAWPVLEQKLFRGWISSQTYAEAEVPIDYKVPPAILWPEVNDIEVENIFEKYQCHFCKELKLEMQISKHKRRELGDQLYWGVFYLGYPPHDKPERQRLLQWGLDDLIKVASWLKQDIGVDVSYQWIKIRSQIGQRTLGPTH